jgi:hypothetical protein
MLDFFKNVFLNSNRYKTHSKAVVVSCFYNPQNSPYRLIAFQKWYRSIKHLNHRIVECLIGPNAKPQLPDSPYITRVYADSLLWHKESLINKIISDLPKQFQYIFWVDADVLFTNQNWLVDGVKELQSNFIIQPFEYCVHLEKNKLVPDFDVEAARSSASEPDKTNRKNKRLWRSFCANFVTTRLSSNIDYDVHGHVGFAWGARREILEQCPLYDHALIGGADHIIAHAAAGHIPHSCITKSFSDNIDEVLDWSKKFWDVVRGRIGYVQGDLYHIWHGDIKNRQYLQRIKDFTPKNKNIVQRDRNGLYSDRTNDEYMRRYFANREVEGIDFHNSEFFDSSFFEDMGYAIYEIFDLFNQPFESGEPEQETFEEEPAFELEPVETDSEPVMETDSETLETDSNALESESELQSEAESVMESEIILEEITDDSNFS